MGPASTANDAWAEQLAVEAPGVERLARRLVGDADAARDVAQDAMLIAMDKGAKVRPAGLRAWLGGIVRNLARRRRAEVVDRRAREAAAARPLEDADRVRERLALHGRLAAAVDALQDPYRTVLTLRFFDGLTARAIAKRTGRPAALVRKHVSRGVAQLRARLDAEDLRDTAAPTWRQQALLAVPGLGAGSTLGGAVTVGGMAMAMGKKGVVAAAAVVVSAGVVAWSMNEGGGVGGEAPSAPTAITAAAGVEESSSVANGAALARKLEREVLTPPRGDGGPVVRVQSEAGEPLAGSKIWTWATGIEPLLAMTDANGEVRLRALQTSGHLVAASPGFVARLVDLDPTNLDARPLLVELTRGRVFSGRVTVDGEAPVEDLSFTLSTTQRADQVGIPHQVKAGLGESGAALAGVDFTARAFDGAFEVSGLPVDWTGRLTLPRGYRVDVAMDVELEEGLRSPVLVVDGLGTGWHLALTRLPFARGRVLWKHSGEPARGASVSWVFALGDGDSTGIHSYRVDDEGRFTAYFEPSKARQERVWRDRRMRPDPASIGLRISMPDAAQELTLRLKAQERPILGDLGDFYLVRARRAHVHVVDAATGDSIEGAHLTPGRKVTDEQGRASFAVPKGFDGTMMVGADGYAIARLVPVRGCGAVDDPHVFELDRGNSVTFTLPHEVLDQERTRLQIYSSEPLFPALSVEGSWSPSIVSRLVYPESCTRASFNSNVGYVKLSVREDRDVTIKSIRTGVAMEAHLLDAFGDAYTTVSVAGLAVAERRVVALGADMRSHSLRGQVLDPEGRPLESAEVVFRRVLPERPEEFDRTEVKTGSDGSFELRFARGDSKVACHVSHPTGGVLARDDLQVWFGRDGLQLRLPARHSVAVRIVDPEGGPVAAIPAFCDLPMVVSSPEQVGVWRFDGLPPGPVGIGCRIGTRLFRMDHRGDEPDCVLRVPRPRKLTLEVGVRSPGDSVLHSDVDAVLLSLADRHGDCSVRLSYVPSAHLWRSEVTLLPGPYTLSCRQRRIVGTERRWEPVEALSTVIEVTAEGPATISL